MSNKVFTVSVSDIQKRKDANLEVFRDVSMISNSTKKTVADKDIYNFSIAKLTNVNAIRNSLHNIFSWIPGQRILQPEFGSNLRKLLYEGITSQNTTNIVADIKYSINEWESRVKVEDVYDASTTDDHENNQIHLIIVYTIPSLSDEQFRYDYIQNITSF